MKKYAALYCREDSAYKLRPQWDVWDKQRDARLYSGNLPVVCHPPCRAWSHRLQARSFRSLKNPGYHRAVEMELGLHSFQMIFSNGGILEHPLNSKIWNIGLRYDGITTTINQYDFGHVASKPTRLFIYPVIDLPSLPMPNLVKPKYSICGDEPGTKDCKGYYREYTPDPLIDWFELVLDKIIEKKCCNTENNTLCNTRLR